MKNLELFFSLLATILGLLITLITFIKKYVSNLKAKKIIEQSLKICNILLPLIEKAEEFSSYTGQEKKEYVMTKANQFALDNGIKFNEEFISNKIEDLLSLTNQVNVNKNKTIKISNKVGNKNGI
ncbi:MAG: phage holin, LLH family [Bacilli bacterium]